MYMLFITYVHVVFSVDFYANILQRLDSIVMYVFIRMYILSLCIIILLALTTHFRVLASSVLRFRDHTKGRTTVGRTTLDE